MKKIFLYILLATILFANEQNYIEIGGGSEKLIFHQNQEKLLFN